MINPDDKAKLKTLHAAIQYSARAEGVVMIRVQGVDFDFVTNLSEEMIKELIVQTYNTMRQNEALLSDTMPTKMRIH